jgi:hypothetical protein
VPAVDRWPDDVPLRGSADHADILIAMTTNTPRTLPSKVVRFDIRSILKNPPAPSVGGG